MIRLETYKKQHHISSERENSIIFQHTKVYVQLLYIQSERTRYRDYKYREDRCGLVENETRYNPRGQNMYEVISKINNAIITKLQI